MRRPNIRWRLTLWYGTVLAATLAGFSVAVYALTSHELLALTDAALTEELADFAGDASRCRTRDDFARELGPRYGRLEGYESQLSRTSGEINFRSDGLTASGLPLPSNRASTDRTSFANGNLARLGHVRLAWREVTGPVGPMIAQVAVSMSPNDRALRELLTAMLVAGSTAVAVTLGGGYWLARQALAPVDRMVATAREITSTRLDRRLTAPDPNDEIGRLAATFNGVIERLQRSFEEIRRFSADAAHELRTPLASMRTQAEVALQSPRSPDRDQRVFEDLLEEIDRLTRLVTQLLFLCREDVRLPSGEAPAPAVRLDEVVADVANHMQVVAREKGLSLDLNENPLCLVRGDVDRLRQLCFNILDNAIKYTTAGGTVRVSSRCGDGLAVLTVSDTGIGIPAEHLPRVFDRFYRVDPARSREVEGTGLGLSICRAIAEAHRGRITIESAPGRGTLVVVTLPVESPERA